MLCAISPNVGLIHHTIIVGGARQSHFNQFIPDLFDCDFGQPLVQCQEFGKTYIVFDNAPCHRSVEIRLNDIITMNFELVRLPHYSCELNPMEFTFNSLKAHVKRALSQHGPYIPSVGTTFVAARRQLLLNVCPGPIQSITQVATRNALYHVLTVTAPKANRLEDL